MARVAKARVKYGGLRLSWHCAVRPSWPAHEGAPTTCSWKTWDFAVLARRKAVADLPNWSRPVQADRPCTRSGYRPYANRELTTVTTIVKHCSAMSPTAMQHDVKHASTLGQQKHDIHVCIHILLSREWSTQQQRIYSYLFSFQREILRQEHPSEFALLSGSSGNVGGPADRFGKATGQLTFDKCAFGFRYRTGLLTKDGSSQLNISHTFYT